MQNAKCTTKAKIIGLNFLFSEFLLAGNYYHLKTVFEQRLKSLECEEKRS